MLEDLSLPYLRIGVVYDGKDGKSRVITGWRGEVVLYQFWPVAVWSHFDKGFSASCEVFLRHFTPKGGAT